MHLFVPTVFVFFLLYCQQYDSRSSVLSKKCERTRTNNWTIKESTQHTSRGVSKQKRNWRSILHQTNGGGNQGATIQSRSLEVIDDKVISDALKNTCWTMIFTMLFGFGVLFLKGKKSAMEFLTGFLVEKSLSVDNLFVFLMLFDYFKVPFVLQGKVLTYGLMGAVLMRGVMIAVGVSAIQRFRWIILVFSVILMLSSLKLMLESFHVSPRSPSVVPESDDLSDNLMLNICKKCIHTTEKLHDEKFFIQETVAVDPERNIVKARNVATPLFACLMCIELSDLAFAVDSIPAVLGISKDPFIVYTSNIFAILGMRSLYILISRAVEQMKYIRPAVAAILLFVSLKMIAEFFHVDISAVVSLSFILGILVVGVIASIFDSKRN